MIYVARKRMLDPAFFTSTAVNSVPISAMVTFAGLWVYFDDYGRGEADVQLIKATIWPRRRTQTEARVKADIVALVSVGLVHPYEVGGVPLIHSVSWQEHQRMSHPTASKLPPCPTHEDLLYLAFLRDSGGPLERFRRASGKPPEAYRDSVVQFSLEKISLRADDGPADDAPPSAGHGQAEFRAARARLRAGTG